MAGRFSQQHQRLRPNSNEDQVIKRAKEHFERTLIEVGGDLAVELESLYVFMIDKLIEANIKNDPECLDVVENLMRTLYIAWKDVIENPRPDGVPSKSLQKEEYQEWEKKSLGDSSANTSKVRA